MKRFYYYAELNDNDVCIRIVSSTSKMNGSRYVEIPEYNETLYMYRKYDLTTGWSQETYEPNVDTGVQDKLIELEATVFHLNNANQELVATNTTLAENVTLLESSVMELINLLAVTQGGVE